MSAASKRLARYDTSSCRCILTTKQNASTNNVVIYCVKNATACRAGETRLPSGHAQQAILESLQHGSLSSSRGSVANSIAQSVSGLRRCPERTLCVVCYRLKKVNQI